MDKDKLLGVIKLRGLTVPQVLADVDARGVSLSKGTFYKGLRDERPFKTNEIKALAAVIKLDRDDVMDIFFTPIVS